MVCQASEPTKQMKWNITQDIKVSLTVFPRSSMSCCTFHYVVGGPVGYGSNDFRPAYKKQDSQVINLSC